MIPLIGWPGDASAVVARTRARPYLAASGAAHNGKARDRESLVAVTASAVAPVISAVVGAAASVVASVVSASVVAIVLRAAADPAAEGASRAPVVPEIAVIALLLSDPAAAGPDHRHALLVNAPLEGNI